MKPQQRHIDKAREVWGEIMSTDTNAISIIATALAEAEDAGRASMREPPDMSGITVDSMEQCDRALKNWRELPPMPEGE